MHDSGLIVFVCLTSGSWSCMHQANNSGCSPSAQGRHRRFCHQFDHNLHSQSWWRLCRDSAARLGNFHKTTPAEQLPWAPEHDWMLQKVRRDIQWNKNYKVTWQLMFIKLRDKKKKKKTRAKITWEIIAARDTNKNSNWCFTSHET